jgi:hypothetical protein
MAEIDELDRDFVVDLFHLRIAQNIVHDLLDLACGEEPAIVDHAAVEKLHVFEKPGVKPGQLGGADRAPGKPLIRKRLDIKLQLFGVFFLNATTFRKKKAGLKPKKNAAAIARIWRTKSLAELSQPGSTYSSVR